MRIADCRDLLVLAGYVRMDSTPPNVYEFEKDCGDLIYSVLVYHLNYSDIEHVDCYRHWRMGKFKYLHNEGLCTSKNQGGRGSFMYGGLPVEGVVGVMCGDPDHIVAELGRVSVEKTLGVLG